MIQAINQDLEIQSEQNSYDPLHTINKQWEIKELTIVREHVGQNLIQKNVLGTDSKEVILNAKK